MGSKVGYLEATRDLGVSLVLVLPLLVAYLFGLMLLDFEVVNGADFITRFVVPTFGVRGLVILNLGLCAVFIVAASKLEERSRFRPNLFLPLVAESAVYASLLGTVIIAIMRKGYLVAAPVAAAGAGAGAGAALGEGGAEAARIAVISIGAGVNEELVFRLVGLTSLLYVLREYLGLTESAALVVAVVLTSALFAGAHHVGAHGEPFRPEAFIYRYLAGTIFAILYRVRGFAPAVYTHAIYDVFVLAA